MLFLNNSVKVSLKNCAAIGFVLTCLVCFVSPLIGQPIRARDFSASDRKRMTQQTQARIDELTELIKKDSRNVILYKQRLLLFYDLLELNFDNKGWETYGDEAERELSRIIGLEPTAENYRQRGDFLRQILYHSPPPNKVTELYPHNQYFERALSDYLEAVRLATDLKQLETVYSMLSGLYTLRPQKLISAPNFPKLLVQIQLKSIFEDFDSAIKYSRKALEAGVNQPYADGLKANLVEIYMTIAELAVKLGSYQVSLEYYQTGQNYIAYETSLCKYYARWGNVYLKLKQPDKALEKFNAITITENTNCAEVLENRGDAFVAKGEFERALSDYNKALTLDKSDSLKRKGWLYLKRAKLFVKMSKPEDALVDLNTAIEKRYVADCPQFYEIRAKAYRKLGKSAMAVSDDQTANKLKNQPNCPFD